MSLFKVFDISSSGITAQSRRLNVTASNLANAESAGSSESQVYKAKQVVFQPVSALRKQNQGEALVKVNKIVEDNSPSRRIYDPKHPMSGEDGYVHYPNVNGVEEMVNMLSASRSYQSNVEVMNTTKNLLLKTLQLGS
jgi:flagellar basal-body rod protein FlgC